MESGNSAVTSSGLSGAAGAGGVRKSMSGCWRKEEKYKHVNQHRSQ